MANRSYGKLTPLTATGGDNGRFFGKTSIRTGDFAISGPTNETVPEAVWQR